MYININNIFTFWYVFRGILANERIEWFIIRTVFHRPVIALSIVWNVECWKIHCLNEALEVGSLNLVGIQ